MKKRVLSLFLAMACLLSLSAPALAAEGGGAAAQQGGSVSIVIDSNGNVTVNPSSDIPPWADPSPAAPAPSAAGRGSGSMDHFKKINAYQPGMFADVASQEWFAGNVGIVYEYGLMNGSGGRFSPEDGVTLAQALAIACRLHSIYQTGAAEFGQGNPWYQTYVNYALDNKLIDPKDAYNYEAPATRAAFARLIGRALPGAGFQTLNQIPDGAIPDVSSGSPFQDAMNALQKAGLVQEQDVMSLYMMQMMMGQDTGGQASPLAAESYEAIYSLYRAGIVTGNDAYGTFTPEAGITRAAVAAILSRVLEPSLRKTVSLSPKPVSLTPLSQLANRASLQKKMSQEEFSQAYEAARKIVEPLAGLSREAQLYGVAIALRLITEKQIDYSMSAPHYNDPYGFFVLHNASCAGCTRATGLCLNMLGLPYEHVNENEYQHQWTRVNLNGVYWVCDAFGMACGPEPAPYQHPFLS